MINYTDIAKKICDYLLKNIDGIIFAGIIGSVGRGEEEQGLSDIDMFFVVSSQEEKSNLVSYIRKDLNDTYGVDIGETTYLYHEFKDLQKQNAKLLYIVNGFINKKFITLYDKFNLFKNINNIKINKYHILDILAYINNKINLLFNGKSFKCKSLFTVMKRVLLIDGIELEGHKNIYSRFYNLYNDIEKLDFDIVRKKSNEYEKSKIVLFLNQCYNLLNSKI